MEEIKLTLKNNQIGILNAENLLKCGRCGFETIYGFLPISQGHMGSYSLVPYCKNCLKVLI